MPATGAATEAVFSATVVKASTTLSSWSELSVEAGRSRTHGEPAGEKEDTSDLLVAALLVLAVSATTLESFPNDRNPKSSFPITIINNHSIYLSVLPTGVQDPHNAPLLPRFIHLGDW
jgi:hypothetical protein